jgi:hypothetical protein
MQGPAAVVKELESFLYRSERGARRLQVLEERALLERCVRAPHDVVAVVEGVFAQLRDEAERRAISLSVTPIGDVPFQLVDRDLLEVALGACADLALDEVGKSGSIAAEVRMDASALVIELVTSGPGLGSDPQDDDVIHAAAYVMAGNVVRSSGDTWRSLALRLPSIGDAPDARRAS